MVPSQLLGELCAGLSPRSVWPCLMVSEESVQGSVSFTLAHSGSGSCPSTVWVSTDSGVAAA